MKTLNFRENCNYFAPLMIRVNEEWWYLIILQNNNGVHVFRILFQAIPFKSRHLILHCSPLSLSRNVYGFITHVGSAVKDTCLLKSILTKEISNKSYFQLTRAYNTWLMICLLWFVSEKQQQFNRRPESDTIAFPSNNIWDPQHLSLSAFNLDKYIIIN